MKVKNIALPQLDPEAAFDNNILYKVEKLIHHHKHTELFNRQYNIDARRHIDVERTSCVYRDEQILNNFRLPVKKVRDLIYLFCKISNGLILFGNLVAVVTDTRAVYVLKMCFEVGSCRKSNEMFLYLVL